MAKGDIIRDWECEGCAQPVNLKETEKGKAYYICGGELADTACSHRAFFGAGPSRRIITEAKEENTDAKTIEHQIEDEAEAQPETEVEPEGEGEIEAEIVPEEEPEKDERPRGRRARAAKRAKRTG